MTSMRGREFHRLDLNVKLSNAVRNDCCLVLINNRQCVELVGIVWDAVLALLQFTLWSSGTLQRRLLPVGAHVDQLGCSRQAAMLSTMVLCGRLAICSIFSLCCCVVFFFKLHTIVFWVFLQYGRQIRC